MRSGIKMAHLNLLPASPADRDTNRPLNQGTDERTFVVGGAADVGLRIRNGPSSFRRVQHCLFCKCLSANSSFRIVRSYWSQADTAESNRHILTNVAVHHELDGGTRGRIHRRRALERQKSATASPGWNFHDNLANQFVMS